MYPQNDMNSLIEKMKRIIGLKSDQIFKEWFEALKGRWGKETNQKIKFLIKEKEEKEDLLSLLLKILPNEDEIKEKYFYASFRKVRTEVYSIFDFFLEVSCLEKSVNNVLKSSKELDEVELLDGMYLIRNRLYGIFGKILKDTSEIYEHVAESGIRSFCHLDTKGRIIYANKEMKKLIGLESIAGEKIDSFFEGEDKKFVRRILASESKEHQGMRQLQLKHRDGQLIPVGVDIGSILIDGVNRGGYISMVEIDLYIADREILLALSRWAGKKKQQMIVSKNYYTIEPYALFTRADNLELRYIANRTLSDIFKMDIYKIFDKNFPGKRMNESLRQIFRLQQLLHGSDPLKNK